MYSSDNGVTWHMYMYSSDNGVTWHMYMYKSDNGVTWHMYMYSSDNGVTWHMYMYSSGTVILKIMMTSQSCDSKQIDTCTLCIVWLTVAKDSSDTKWKLSCAWRICHRRGLNFGSNTLLPRHYLQISILSLTLALTLLQKRPTRHTIARLCSNNGSFV